MLTYSETDLNSSFRLETEGFLGRYRQQVTAIAEGRERVLFGWLYPGGEKFSVTRAFFSSLMSGQFGGGRKFNFTTSTNGSHRASLRLACRAGVRRVEQAHRAHARGAASGSKRPRRRAFCPRR